MFLIQLLLKLTLNNKGFPYFILNDARKCVVLFFDMQSLRLPEFYLNFHFYLLLEYLFLYLCRIMV